MREYAFESLPVCMYVDVFSFLHPGRYTYVYMLRVCLYYDTCAPLHRPVYMYVHIRDQNDNATYASTRWVLAVRGKHFFVKYGGPSDGSPLSGGGIVILRVIRRHFIAAVVDRAVSLSTYNTLSMEVVP